MAETSYRDDKVTTATTLWQLCVRLWPYMRRLKWRLFAVILAVAGLVVVGRLLPSLFGQAMDKGFLQKNNDVLIRIAVLYLGLEILRTIFLFLHSYLFAQLGNRMLFELRSNLVKHVQNLPLTFFDKNPTGRIVTRITTDVINLGEMFTQGIIFFFSNGLSLIAIVIAMYVISWKMATATLMIAPFLIWFSFYLSNRIRNVLRESKKKIAAINAFVSESIGGMRILQLYLRIPKSQTRFDQMSHEYKLLQMQAVRLYAFLWPVVNFFNAASIAIALYVGGWLTSQNAISTGTMIAFILHVRDFINPLRVILEKYQIFQSSLSGAERIFTLLDELEEVYSGRTLPSDRRLDGAIEFTDLNFKYSEDGPLILKDVNVHINPGESVALVGRTGSGKSTFIALLQRFYDYSSGEIRIDGYPLKELARASVRQRIGVVQQDPFLFRGTIADNIGLRDPRITREQIETAAQKAHCADLLRRHVGGLDAWVEERGANLSHGERQLIAFARILAFDPDILILDEATANIDSESEAAIQQATIEAVRGRTSLIIAHRLSTVQKCQKFLVFEQGHVQTRASLEPIIQP